MSFNQLMKATKLSPPIEQIRKDSFLLHSSFTHKINYKAIEGERRIKILAFLYLLSFISLLFMHVMSFSSYIICSYTSIYGYALIYVNPLCQGLDGGMYTLDVHYFMTREK